MSTLETNLIQPSSGTTLTVGASGDTISMASGTTNRLLTPVVRVYGSADQTGLAHNAYNTMAFNTEQLDTASAFNTSTYKFTVPEAGYYLINLQFSVMTTGGTLITVLCGVYNETQSTNAVGNFRMVSNGDHSSTNEPYTRSISNVPLLAANDVLYARAYTYASSGNLTIKHGLNGYSQMSIFKVA